MITLDDLILQDAILAVNDLFLQEITDEYAKVEKLTNELRKLNDKVKLPPLELDAVKMITINCNKMNRERIVHLKFGKVVIELMKIDADMLRIQRLE